MTQQQIRELQLVAIQDYKKRLITRTQLVNIVHQLDRKSFIHSAWTKQASSSLSSGLLVYWPHSRCTRALIAHHITMNNKEKSNDWLIRNAIGCWLHHFPEHQWTEQYKQLIQRDTFITEVKAQGRRRPAKRARQTKASTKETTTGSTPQPN